MTRVSSSFTRGFREHRLAAGLALSVVGVVGVTSCGNQTIDGVSPEGTGGRVGTPTTGVGANGFVGTGSGGTSAASCIPAGGSASGLGGSTPLGIIALSGPNFSGMGTSAEPPPPISGGTLIILRDGITAVAADPDRDLIYVVDLSDLANPRLSGSIALNPNDQPGRLVEDGAGQVHVVLRNAGALVTVDPISRRTTMRRSVCALPRGLAYDAATDRLHVACAGGELLRFAPTGATRDRTLKLDQDLRDVVVDGSRLMVTRFRSAQVLVVDGDGSVSERISPPSLSGISVHGGTPFEPTVAWRAVAMPGGGAAMVHQRGMNGAIDTQKPGGYGGPSCDSIIHTAVTVVKAGQKPVAGPAMPGLVLPVDIALSNNGQRMAVVAAGNGHNSSARRLFVANVDDVALPWNNGCGNDGIHGPLGRSCGGIFISPGAGGAIGAAGGRGGASAQAAGGTAGGGGPGSPVISGTGGASGTTYAMCNDLPSGVEPIAVAFAGADVVVVQTREPAQLWVVRQLSATAGTQVPVPLSVPLSPLSRGDTGHAVFHSNSGAGLACASCHPEGHEDGRTWNFLCEGGRRTQDIGGGLSGTEPFHWNGELANFPALVDAVFVGRMSGPALTLDQTAAALAWINSVPARPAIRGAGDPQVDRGRIIFQDPSVGCTTCHAGSLFTNNMTVTVGTGGLFQVPSLREVAWRSPYLHNGCAPDLAARFNDHACGGGDAHGKTSQLTEDSLADLVAFLESL